MHVCGSGKEEWELEVCCVRTEENDKRWLSGYEGMTAPVILRTLNHSVECFINQGKWYVLKMIL